MTRKLGHKNDFIDTADCTEMVIFDRECKEKARSLVDTEDVEMIRNVSWCVDSNGYVMNGKLGTLHKFLLGKRDGYEIDHINRDKLDNRKSNLRHITKAGNNTNVSKRSNNVYQLPGGNWVAYVRYQGKQNHLGTFSTKEEAMRVAKQEKERICELYKLSKEA